MWLLLLMIWGCLLPVGNALADDDYLDARRLMEAGLILPLHEILGRIQEGHAGRILEVELEHESGQYIYEIEILDEKGVVREWEINATSGEILKPEQEE